MRNNHIIQYILKILNIKSLQFTFFAKILVLSGRCGEHQNWTNICGRRIRHSTGNCRYCIVTKSTTFNLTHPWKMLSILHNTIWRKKTYFTLQIYLDLIIILKEETLFVLSIFFNKLVLPVVSLASPMKILKEQELSIISWGCSSGWIKMYIVPLSSCVVTTTGTVE